MNDSSGVTPGQTEGKSRMYIGACSLGARDSRYRSIPAMGSMWGIKKAPIIERAT